MAVYADLVRYRELFANLFRRDFQAKYRGSVLGVAWSLVNPLALMAVYLVVFGLMLETSTKIAHYPLYLLAGIACWIFFGVALQTAARSMVDSSELIRKVRFPRQLVAFSVVATQAVTFAVMLAILVVLVTDLHAGARGDGLALDPACSRSSSRSSPASRSLVACLNVVFRDVEHILAAALLPWFFLTPILWSFADAAGERAVSSEAARRPALGQHRHPADLRRTRPALARPRAHACRHDLPRSSPPPSRSSSDRSSSAASTIGSRSSSDRPRQATTPSRRTGLRVEHDPPVVEPRLVGRRGERRQAGDIRQAFELDPGSTDGQSSGCGKPGIRPGPGRTARSPAADGGRAAVPGDRAGDDGVALRMGGGDALRRSRGGPHPAGQLGARRARRAAARRRRPGRLAAELREPGAVLGDEVEGEAVAAGRDRRAHARLDGEALAGRERGKRPCARRPTRSGCRDRRASGRRA